MATPRQRRGGAAGPRLGPVRTVFEDYRPVSEWSEDDDTYILTIEVPGFTKEQLKVSTEDRNIIRVRGERLAAGNKWLRFQEDFRTPDNSELTSVRARHEGGTLIITIPRRKIATKEEATRGTLSPSPKVQDRVLPTQTTDTKLPRVTEPNLQGRDSITPLSTRKPVTEDRSTRKPITEDKAPEPKPEIEKMTDGDMRKKVGQPEEQIQKRTEKQGEPESIADKEGKKIADQKASDKSSELPGIMRTTGDHLSTITSQQEDKSKSYIGKGKEITEVEDQKKIKSSDPGAFRTELKKYKKAVEGIGELSEERQSLVNMGAALLVIVALSAYVTYNFASQNAK